MFGKKCKKCGGKVSKDYEFCPYCGSRIKREEDERNFGLLGKEDSLEFNDMGIRMPFGLNRIFSTLLSQIDRQFKELDKEMGKDLEEQKADKELPKLKSRGISISISTESGKKPEIKVRGLGPDFTIKQEKEEKEKEIIKSNISDYQARKLSKLPKEEAETKVRRLSNRIVYEINLPGVKSVKNIIINKLENSIEIKAFSKEKAYFKLLPVSLPILNYKLQKEKLILELKG